jgi:hypothetical protein
MAFGAAIGSFFGLETIALSLAPAASRVLEHPGVVEALGHWAGVGPDGAQTLGTPRVCLAAGEVNRSGGL